MMTKILNNAEKAVIPEPDMLRWETAPYSNGKEKIADYNGESRFRYHVRRSSPRSRLWLAKRNGDFFDKALYSSQEAAMKACEEDAKSPKTRLKDRKHA